MKITVSLGVMAIAVLTAGSGHAADGETLAAIKERDQLLCGVNPGLVGFALPDANGNWNGFDVSLCKAIAAAVLRDSSKVKYIPVTSKDRFDVLNSGAVDLLARNSTWTFVRDTSFKVDFAGVYYYDGQGFMVRKSLGITSAKELNGLSICFQSGTTTEQNVIDYFSTNNMSYRAVDVESNAESEQNYLAGDCDAYTTDASGLAAARAAFANPDDHVVLPEIISKEPLGPVVREGDDSWENIVRWTLFALIAAEEYGITSANLEELSKSSTNPEIRRLLGSTNNFGEKIGLDQEWAKRAIAASGNYGEIFAATIGEQTPVGLARGLNAQWTQGGLMYAMPFQ